MHHGQFSFWFLFLRGREEGCEQTGTSLCGLYFYDHPSLSRFLLSNKNIYRNSFFDNEMVKTFLIQTFYSPMTSLASNNVLNARLLGQYFLILKG